MGVRVWLMAGLVAVAAFAVFAASPVTTVSDSRWTLPAAISLERHGDLDLDEYQHLIQVEGGYGAERAKSGHVYNYFPYGTSVLIAPVVWLADVAGGRHMESTARHQKVEDWERLLASLIAALATAVLFLVGFVLLDSVPLALLGAAVFALGTSAWSTASRALWMHGPDMLLFSVALLLALLSARRPALAAFTALPLAMAFVVRPTGAAAIAAFTGWMVWQRRRQLPAFAGLGLLVAVPFFLANRAMFGQWLSGYYGPGRYGPPHVLTAVAGDLVSPGRGILVFSPVLLVLVLRRQKLTPLDWAAAGAIALHLFLIARFWQWWGGFAFGPRLFSDVLPFFVFLLLPVLKDLRRPPIGVAFGALFALSVFINWRGATDFDTWLWNSQPVSVDAKQSRLWDWTDLQFLRGL